MAIGADGAERADTPSEPPRVGGIAGDHLRAYIERIERLEEEKKAVAARAQERAEERMLDVLLPLPEPSRAAPPENVGEVIHLGPTSAPDLGENAADPNSTREKFRRMLRQGELDEREVEIDPIELSADTWATLPERLVESCGDDRDLARSVHRALRSLPTLVEIALDGARESVQPQTPWSFSHTAWELANTDMSTVYDMMAQRSTSAITRLYQ